MLAQHAIYLWLLIKYRERERERERDLLKNDDLLFTTGAPTGPAALLPEPTIHPSGTPPILITIHNKFMSKHISAFNLYEGCVLCAVLSMKMGHTMMNTTHIFI